MHPLCHILFLHPGLRWNCSHLTTIWQIMQLCGARKPTSNSEEDVLDVFGLASVSTSAAVPGLIGKRLEPCVFNAAMGSVILTEIKISICTFFLMWWKKSVSNSCIHKNLIVNLCHYFESLLTWKYFVISKWTAWLNCTSLWKCCLFIIACTAVLRCLLPKTFFLYVHLCICQPEYLHFTWLFRFQIFLKTMGYFQARSAHYTWNIPNASSWTVSLH